MKKKVIVIGGGLGALSGAIRLASKGFKVQLFEQNENLGGKCNEVISGSYRFDTGPSLLTMPFVIEELFQFAGFDISEFLQFLPVDPICRYYFPDGSMLDTSGEQNKMLSAIESISPKDVDSYLRYMEYCKGIYDFAANLFLFTPIHEIRKLLKQGNFKTLLNIHKLDAFNTVHNSVSRFFSDNRLVQLFDRYATYNGSNPFKAPATLNIISYVEYGLGGYYIKGGMYGIVKALATIAKKLGVEIHTSAKIEKILWNDRRVKGVIIEGEKIPADYVLCNSDVVFTYNSLLDGVEAKRHKLNKLEPSISGMVFLWGIGKKNPELKHHNIIFSSDYKREFDQIFHELNAPDDPTIYISISSKTDPEHAPNYGENWFILLNMPYLTDKSQNWNTEKDRMRDAILNKLKKTGIDIYDKIEFEKIYTPEDFLGVFSSNRGSIYGVSSNNMTMAFKRHANRSRDIQGLYFAGGSVHPGGGIPIVLLSGKIAADLIIEKEKK